MRDPSTKEDPEHSAHAEPASASSREIMDAVRALKRELANAIRELKVLASIQVDRALIFARESAWAIAFALVAFVVLVVLLVVATIAFMRGLCAGLSEWFGAEWAGSLAGGGIALVIVGAGLVLARGRMRAAGLRRLRKKYESDPPAAAGGGA